MDLFRGYSATVVSDPRTTFAGLELRDRRRHSAASQFISAAPPAPDVLRRGHELAEKFGW